MDISIWEKTGEEEVNCFINGFSEGWVDEFKAWSIISIAGQPDKLGYNLRNDNLIIAKFVGDQNQWHGYPADTRFKPADKPIPRIMQDWLNKGLIKKSLMSRVKRGQV